MKKLLLSFCILLIASKGIAQVVCAGVSPASIAGNYSFSWSDPANSWASPDFNVPGTSVTGDLMLVDDGSVGNSPASGLPLSIYGCATLVNSLTGKIAVVYRYDGVTASTICWMSEKAKYAQDAGAIAVVVVNRPGANEDLGTGGGTAAPTVNIPVVMISYEDGNALRTEMLNGPVTMFLGNKTGLFTDDIGVTKETRLIPKSTGVVSYLAQDGSEFNFEVGTRVYNYGTNDQSNVKVIANVDGPLGTSVWSDTVGPLTILSGDSIDVFPGDINSFPLFSLASYPSGNYTLSYETTLDVVDGYPGDNGSSSDFFVSDTIFSYSKLDDITHKPVASNGYRPSVNNSTYSVCTVVQDQNADRIWIEGMYFSASTAYGSGVSLTGEEIALNLYEWSDVFVDLNDAALAFDNLNSISFAYYYFPSDLQGQTVYAPFLSCVMLESNKRYLACAQTVNTSIYLGHDQKTNYSYNEALYLQPFSPNESDGAYYALGFGSDIPSAVGLKVNDFNNCWGIDELDGIQGSVYPNPGNDLITITINTTGSGKIVITDLTGKIVKEDAVVLSEGTANTNISTLDSGAYILTLTMEDGKTGQFRIVKN